jgi:hypothetical protein
MKLKSILLGAGLLALSFPGVTLAQSVPVGHPRAQMQAQAQEPQAEPNAVPRPMTAATVYNRNHQALVATLTKFQAELEKPDNAAQLKDLSDQTTKLTELEKAYQEAYGKDDAAAKQALDDYMATVQSMAKIVVPYQMMAAQVFESIAAHLAPLGGMGELIQQEQDVIDLRAKIDATLDPVNTADQKIGPIFKAAMQSTQERLKQMQPGILDEELARQIGNTMQTKRAE